LGEHDDGLAEYIVRENNRTVSFAAGMVKEKRKEKKKAPGLSSTLADEEGREKETEDHSERWAFLLRGERVVRSNKRTIADKLGTAMDSRRKEVRCCDLD
jgi:hypothetical protein